MQLDRFLKNVAKNPYLFNSEEFKTFLLPPSGDVEKSLSMLPKLSTDQILERIKTFGRLNEVGEQSEADRLSTSMSLG